MKIGYAKLGSSMNFDRHAKKQMCFEELQRLTSITRNNPDDTFYFLGRSQLLDVNNKEMFPHGNIINVWDGFKIGGHTKEHRLAMLNYLVDKGVEVDFAIINSGAVGTYSIPFLSRTKAGNPRSNLMIIENYTSHILHWLNVSKTPWVYCINDPRSAAMFARDCFNRPLEIFSQFDLKYDYEVMDTYDDIGPTKTITEHAKYAAMEKTRLIDINFPQYEKIFNRKKTLIGIICNKGADGDGATKYIQPRFPILKEYILDQFEDVEVYGKWPEKYYTDHRFKGHVSMNKLNPITSSWKYSLCIPIGNGWATAKYVELIQHGVVPFLHPSYDTQNNSNLPEICRVTSPSDFKDKINYLENNPSEYKKLWAELIETTIKPEFISGQFYNETMYNAIHNHFGLPKYEFKYHPNPYHWILDDYLKDDELFDF
jgi:hypothetical protein